MESTMNNGMCRCCASEGTFKDVKSTYHWMGEEEVYSEMLKECFDIALCTNLDGDDGGICEVCITQLRNAVNFKKQVLHTEEQFKERLQTKLFSDNIVKVELGHGSEIESDNDNDHDASGDLSDTEYEVPIKTEDDEPKARKRAAKPSTSKAKRAKKSDGETSKRTTRSRKKDLESTQRENEEVKLKKNVNFSSFINIKPVLRKRSSLAKVPEVKGRVTELDLQLERIKTILRFSNATPIRGYVSSRYACSYCLEQFEQPLSLKTHTLVNHKNDDKGAEFFEIKTLSTFIVYLDITDLKCTVCDQVLSSLNALTEHLMLKHDESANNELRNHLIPFRFDQKPWKCVECSESFVDFKLLEKHTTGHYKNYRCEFCDAGFVNRSIMMDHKKEEHSVQHLQRSKFKKNSYVQ